MRANYKRRLISKREFIQWAYIDGHGILRRVNKYPIKKYGKISSEMINKAIQDDVREDFKKDAERFIKRTIKGNLKKWKHENLTRKKTELRRQNDDRKVFLIKM